MNRETLVKLQMLVNDLEEHRTLGVTCETLSRPLDLIVNQFTLVEAALELVLECLDDLAAHTGYQLKEK